MSDDFGGLSGRRGAANRELEALRKHYREHRDVLSRLAADAPTQQLASEYARLIAGVDASLAKLGELDPVPAAGGLSPRVQRGPAPVRAGHEPLLDETEPMARPLMAGPSDRVAGAYEPAHTIPPSQGRFALFVVVTIAVLSLIGWLVWRGSRKGQAEPSVAGKPLITETTVAENPPPVTPVPRPAAALLTIAPASADYGSIRRGTRAVRQFELQNTGAAVLDYQVARSQCRCLYYEYRGKLAPKQKETLTVTVDGSRVKAASLDETVAVTSKTDPSISAQFTVHAQIK